MAQYSDTSPSLPTDRAFVLQFNATAEVDQGRFEGRVEHLASGQATRFHSLDQLFTFIGRILKGGEVLCLSNAGGNDAGSLGMGRSLRPPLTERKETIHMTELCKTGLSERNEKEAEAIVAFTTEKKMNKEKGDRHMKLNVQHQRSTSPSRGANLVCRSIAILALMGLGGIAPTQIAAAADLAARTIVPATVCQIWGGDAPEFTDNIQYARNGRVYNTSHTSPVAVVCPVPRHGYDSKITVRVYYDDQHPGSDPDRSVLSCELHSNNAYGDAAYDSSGKAQTTGPVDGFDSAYWDFHVDAKNGDYPTNLTLKCNLPVRIQGKLESSIGSIIVWVD